MKKLLIASTALVATAGFAAADVTLSGDGNVGVRYDSTGIGALAQTTGIHNEINFKITGTAASDGGLSLSASTSLEHDNSTAGALTGDRVFSISHSGLTLSFGDVSEAGGVGIADIGFDGIGVDDVVEGLDEGGAHNVNLTYKMDKFTVSVSGTVNDTTAAALTAATAGAGIGIAFDDSTGSGFKFSAGYQDFIGAGRQANIGVGYTAGAFSGNVVYVDQSGGVNVDGWGIDLTYKVDSALSVTFAAADTTAAGINPSYGIGASYNLGGNVMLVGGVGVIDEGAANATRADLGLTFKF